MHKYKLKNVNKLAYTVLFFHVPYKAEQVDVAVDQLLNAHLHLDLLCICLSVFFST